MSDSIEELEELTFAHDKPDVAVLATTYEATLADLGPFFDDCRESYKQRRNDWPGKTRDLRKKGPAAVPWEGASDTEANTVAERINTYVALATYGLKRSNVQALAVSADDFGRAASVAKLVKYMRDSWIPGFANEMEMAANFLFEKAIAATYVGWEKELRTRLQTFTVEQLEQLAPGIGEMIATGDADDELAALIQQMLPTVKDARAKKAVRDLRKTGQAVLTVAVQAIDRPIAESLAVDADIFWPSYVTNFQKSPVVFHRCFLTPQQLHKKAVNDGWDEDWVDKVIGSFRGQDSWRIDGEMGTGPSSISGNWRTVAPTGDNLVMVVYAYQRLIDDDGAEGIYRTAFHPAFTGTNDGVQPYAIHELLDGLDDYPFVVTTVSREQKRLYETTNFGMLLRGAQNAVKVERDQRTDRASLAMGPPIFHPPGRAPSDWGAFRKIPERRPGEYRYGEPPPPDSGSNEVELTQIQQADRLIGLDYEVPNASIRQQFYVDKLLDHAREVLKLARKMCKRYGPPMIEVRITGDPNAETYDNTLADEDMDVTVTFDTLNTDPDTMKAKLENFAALFAMDRWGVMSGPNFLYMAGASIDPGIASGVMQPVETGQQKLTEAVTSDLTKIWSGIGVGAQPNGAEIAMQVISQWMQQPDVADRYETDEAFRERVDTYIKQYQFQLQQAENAVTGRIGTAPAPFQGTNVQPAA